MPPLLPACCLADWLLLCCFDSFMFSLLCGLCAWLLLLVFHTLLPINTDFIHLLVLLSSVFCLSLVLCFVSLCICVSWISVNNPVNVSPKYLC